MYIFTQWNQSPIPEKYAACIAALRVRYPSLVVEDFVSPDGEDPRIESDVRRLRRLVEIDDDALYIDADCVPGPDVFDGDGIWRLAFANNRGGRLDIWAIYKPKGCENQVGEVLNFALSRSFGWWGGVIQSGHDRLYGYPDYRYFLHNGFRGPVINTQS